MSEPVQTLRAVLGAGVRRARERDGAVTQEDLAAAARRWGLPWARTRVALLERGEKAIPAEELALLPLVLTDACKRPVGMAELIDPDAVIGLSDVVTVTGRELAERFAGVAPGIPAVMTVEARPGLALSTAPTLAVGDEYAPGLVVTALPAPDVEIGGVSVSSYDVERYVREAGETEQVAARRLGVPLAHFVVIAHALWGRGFSSERDTRASTGPDVSPHRRSAIRGRVSRALLTEITAELTRRGLIPPTNEATEQDSAEPAHADQGDE
jgi:hypothetical protein